MYEEEEGQFVERHPCEICQRQFVPDALEKHQIVCLKNARKKRKVFDSSKQRVSGLDVLVQQKTGQKISEQERKIKLAQIQNRKNQWRQKHEEFISNIRSAKEYTIAKKSGGPLPPPPPVTVDPNLIQCKWCSRRFNEKAAERHIKFCEEKHRSLPQKQPKAQSIARPTQVNVTRSGDGRSVPPTPKRIGTANNDQSDSNHEEYSSSNIHIGRGVRRGIPAPSVQTKTQQNRSGRNSVSRLTTPKFAQSPTFGSDEVPSNCPRGLAIGKARYVPKGRSIDNREQYNKQPVASPPGLLQIHTPSETLEGDPSDRAIVSRQLKNCSGDSSHRRSEHSQAVSNSQNMLPHSMLPSNEIDVIESTSHPTLNSELSLKRKNNLVLRSGRTIEDYVSAQELARDLVGERNGFPNSKQRIPVLQSGYRVRPQPLVAYSNESSPGEDYHVQANISGSLASLTNYSTKSTRSQFPSELNHDMKMTTHVDVEVDSNNDMPSYTQPNFQRPGTTTHRNNRTTDTRDTTGNPSKLNKFCHECGSQFPNSVAKFCPECGIKRLTV